MRHRILIIILAVVLTGSGCVRYTPVRTPGTRGKNPYGAVAPASFSEYIRTVLKTSQENTKASEEALAKIQSSRPELAGLARQALERPHDLESRHTLAQIYLEAQLYAEALRFYREILDKAPDDAPAEMGMAFIWDMWGEYSLAESHARHAAALDRESVGPRELLGRICLHRADLDGAAAEFAAALRIAPRDASLLANTGYVFLLRGNWEEARQYLEHAIEIDTTIQEARNNLGIVLANLNDTAGALRQFAAAGSQAAAFNNLGVVYLAQNRLVEAREQFLMALKCQPDYPKALANLNEANALLPMTTIHVIKPHAAPMLVPAEDREPLSETEDAAAAPLIPEPAAGAEINRSAVPSLTSTSISASGGHYTLQMFSSQSKEAADEKMRKLAGQGVDFEVIRTELKGKGTWYRVRLKADADRNTVLVTADRLVKAGIIRDFCMISRSETK